MQNAGSDESGPASELVRAIAHAAGRAPGFQASPDLGTLAEDLSPVLTLRRVESRHRFQFLSGFVALA